MIHNLLLHPSDRPLFSVALRAAGCAVELWVNDVPIFRDSEGASLNFTMPINEWLFRGAGEIQLRCRDLADGVGKVTCTLEYRRLRQPWKHSVPIETLRSEDHGFHPTREHAHSAAWETDAIENAQPAPFGEPMEFRVRKQLPQWNDASLILAIKFHLPAPWLSSPWADAAALTEQPNLTYSVRQLTQEFWGILSRGDKASLLRLLAIRAEALESAYHLNTSEVEEALFIPKLLQTPEWRVAAFPQEELQLEVAGLGKLARVVDPNTGESPLRLINEASSLEATIDAWWAFGNKWLLMR
jgi:hypothetical protein